MYYRSDKVKTIFVIIHGLSVAIIESIMLIILGAIKQDYKPSMAIFIVVIIVEIGFECFYNRIQNKVEIE